MEVKCPPVMRKVHSTAIYPPAVSKVNIIVKEMLIYREDVN